MKKKISLIGQMITESAKRSGYSVYVSPSALLTPKKNGKTTKNLKEMKATIENLKGLKAIDLLEILAANPDAEICTGDRIPFIQITKCRIYNIGRKTRKGFSIDKDGYSSKVILTLQ